MQITYNLSNKLSVKRQTVITATEAKTKGHCNSSSSSSMEQLVDETGRL